MAKKTAHNPLPAPARFRRSFQGAALGTLIGCSGAYLMTLMFKDTPLYLLAMVAGGPALTGFFCAFFHQPRHISGLSASQDPRTVFVARFTHMGSLIGLNNFLLRFGMNRGLFHSLADYAEVSTPANPAPSAGEATLANSKSFEKQYPTVTTITYDTQTNTPTSDTIARDRLASARLALLSMDHTKQIPH